MRHGGDRRQRFAAEAHCLDGFEPVLVPELGGRVPQKGDPGILRRHAAAIVGDADHGRAAIPDLDRDVLRAGVKGVLHQLLDHRSRALHDLAGRNQVGDMRREQIDMRHKGFSLRHHFIIKLLYSIFPDWSTVFSSGADSALRTSPFLSAFALAIFAYSG